MVNRELHYCKFCSSNFHVKIHEKETGDFLLICPGCGWEHYRRFKNGVAIHCEIQRSTGKLIKIQGR